MLLRSRYYGRDRLRHSAASHRFGPVQSPTARCPRRRSLRGPRHGQPDRFGEGVDYLRIRADGRIDLDIHATIETKDGCRIALSADGVGTPRATEPIADLCENVRLTTAAEAYAWVNTRQVWAVGTVDFATGKIHLDAYQQ